MSVAVITTVSDAPSAAKQIAEHVYQLRRAAPAATPCAALVYAPVALDSQSFLRGLVEETKVEKILGCTSFSGAMCEAGRGATATRPGSCAILWLVEGQASLARVTFGNAVSVRELGRELATNALAHASFPEDATSFGILHATPGCEEELLAGIYEVLPTSVALIGGSAADQDLSGKWRVFSGAQSIANGAALGLFSWPGKVTCALRGGYLPTAKKAVVTRALGRVIYALDGEPAADVYDRWSGDALTQSISQQENLLAKTTYNPLGVVRARVHGTELFVLAHPERSVLPERGLALFAEIREGEEVTMMHASEKMLLSRSGWAANDAMRQVDLQPDALAGALLVYCGGCAMAIESRLPAMIQAMSQVLVDVPFVATYTFGEQGTLVSRKTEHGNLMSSVLLLGKPNADEVI